MRTSPLDEIYKFSREILITDFYYIILSDKYLHIIPLYQPEIMK